MNVVDYCLQNVGNEKNTVYAVVRGWQFTVLVMEVDRASKGWEGFGFVINHDFPECSELGYLDLRQYDMTGMEVVEDFTPCSLSDAKLLYMSKSEDVL